VIPLPEPTRGSHSTRPIWLLVGLLLLVPIVVPLLVPLYDQRTPTLIGFPFFFWFQFMLIPVASLFTFIAFKLSQSGTARDRQARGQSYGPTDGSGEPR
jgi:hypothetical protein